MLQLNELSGKYNLWNIVKCRGDTIIFNSAECNLKQTRECVIACVYNHSASDLLRWGSIMTSEGFPCIHLSLPSFFRPLLFCHVLVI